MQRKLLVRVRVNKTFLDILNAEKFKKNIGNTSKPDSIVEGVITKKFKHKNGDEYFLVNAGLKSDGIVSVKDFHGDTPAIGEKIKLLVVKAESDGKILLSYSKLKRRELADKLKEIYEKSQPISVKVEIVLENGYKVHILDDVYGFLPSEDCDSEKFQQGDTIQNAYISKFVKHNINKINVSLKNVRNVSRDDIIECEIKEIIGDTAFVYIKNCNIKEGLIHKTDMDFKHQILFDNETPTKTPDNKSFKAKIVNIDENNFAILSVQKLISDYLSQSKYKVGDEVECKIVYISEVGLMVTIDEYIEGFIHIYEVAWNSYNLNLKEIYTIGQTIKAKIIVLDKQKKQIKLSIKQLEENVEQNPFNKFMKTYNVNDIVEEAVVLKTPPGNGFVSYRFLQLFPGVDGRLTVREMDWDEEKGKSLFDRLEEGQKIKVQITSIDPATKRVNVSLKSMTPDRFDEASKKFSIGRSYECEVLECSPEGLRVKIGDTDFEGRIPTRELDINMSNCHWRNFQNVKSVNAKLIGKDGRLFFLSIKAKQRDETTSDMKKHCSETRKSTTFSDLFE